MGGIGAYYHRTGTAQTEGIILGKTPHSLSYPRRRWQRGLLHTLGRIIVPLLTRTELHGLDHIPAHGPLIVVGNHIAAMEVVLMVVYAPWQIELLGPGDIPPPPAMNAISEFYGFIPINRGNLDRQAITQALDILKQSGVLGMFPEGGIWDPGAMEAKRGVAWLSHRTQAPILPIGFGGVEGALDAVFKLKRPHLVMNVGEVMPPVNLPPNVSRRAALQNTAAHILERVRRLIPPQYRKQREEITDERFELRLTAIDTEGDDVVIPDTLTVQHKDDLAKFFYRPHMLRIFAKDLHRSVTALQYLDTEPPAEALVAALDQILHYVDNENPGFFPYRFGTQEGIAMETGLRELRRVAAWAADAGYALKIQPIRHYRLEAQGEEITETQPDKAHTW